MTKPEAPQPIITKDLPKKIREVFAKSSCLFSKTQVDSALDKMATAMSYELAHTNPIFLCVVVGGIIPMGHLLLRLNFPLEVDYIHATRYRGETTGKDLQYKREPSTDLHGRTIVVVDDILDEGITLSGVVKYCETHGAEKVYTAVLVDKIRTREKGGWDKADFCGLEVPNRYVFGFGLDYKEYLRNAPGIYAVSKEHE